MPLVFDAVRHMDWIVVVFLTHVAKLVVVVRENLDMVLFFFYLIYVSVNQGCRQTTTVPLVLDYLGYGLWRRWLIWLEYIPWTLLLFLLDSDNFFAVNQLGWYIDVTSHRKFHCSLQRIKLHVESCKGIIYYLVSLFAGSYICCSRFVLYSCDINFCFVSWDFHCVLWREMTILLL